MFLTSIEPSLSRRGLSILRKRLAALTLTGMVILLFSFFFIQKTLYDSAIDQARAQMMAITYQLSAVPAQDIDINLQRVIDENPNLSVGVIDSNRTQISGIIPPHLIGDLFDAIATQKTDRGTVFCMHGNTVMLMGYSTLPQLDRIVVTYIPRRLLLDGWRQAIILHAALFLIVLTIMAGLSIWLWQRLKRQHLRAADLAEHFSDSENTLSECGCAILSWSPDAPDTAFGVRLNWPEILGLAFSDIKPTAESFLSRLSDASRAQLRGPLFENEWPANRIGTMVDMHTSADHTKRFYMMAHRRIQGTQETITVMLLETAEQQELCHPFETYLRHTPEPSVAVDAQGILRGLSPALEHLIGANIHDLIGQPFFRIFEAEDQESAIAAFQECMEHRDHERELIFRIRSQNSGIRWLAWHCIGPFDDMMFGSARDVTQFVENANKLRDTLDQLKRSNEDLEQFAYVASHDLQQPLRMVASYTQLLKRRYGGALDPEADEYIDYAVDGAKRMHKLISHLLEYAKTGGSDDGTEIDCNLALSEAQADLKSIIAQEQATITHTELPTISGDRISLSRLFQNLLSNAIKYRRPGVPPHIDIQVSVDPETPGFWRFSVRDNGIGIHPEHAHRIFRLFQRLHKDEFSGTGLGLSLCRKIVEQHGGRIWLDTSRPLTDPGATFIFTLRASRPE